MNNSDYDVVDFEERIVFRIKKNDLIITEKIIRRDREKYDNLSHFIRCAVIKLNREEAKRLKIPYKEVYK